jgi:poly(hydroxyalkanoate) granule-associated protein
MTTKNFPFNFDFLSTQKLPEGTQQSAQEIWLAGLGAFSKAQKEGEIAFQSLVKDGMNLQKASPQEAQQKIAEATAKMTALASDMATKATGGWGKLENIFEDRVARALKQLGVPSQDDLQTLRDEVSALRAEIQTLRANAGQSPTPGKTAAAAPRRSASAQKTPAGKASTKPKAAAKKPAPKTRSSQ